MFGFSIGEWVLLMAIALIAIGPKQLPEVARTIGRLMNELKRATGDFTRAFTDVRDDTRNTWHDVRKDVGNPFTASAQAYTQTVRAAPEGTVSSRSDSSTPETSAFEEPKPKFPITPDDPFGAGHNPHAHQPPPSPERKEEQLSFRLHDDDEGHS